MFETVLIITSSAGGSNVYFIHYAISTSYVGLHSINICSKVSIGAEKSVQKVHTLLKFGKQLTFITMVYI